MTTREAIEARIPQYMADYDGDEHASLDYFNAIRDLRLMLDLLATVEAERDRLKELIDVSAAATEKHWKRADKAEARAEALARAVKEWQVRHAAREKAKQEELAANYALDRNRYIEAMAVMNDAVKALDAAEQALLALDVQESS